MGGMVTELTPPEPQVQGTMDVLIPGSAALAHSPTCHLAVQVPGHRPVLVWAS